MVFAFVAGRPDQVPQLVSTTPVPLKALAIISPVINRALSAHNRNNPGTVNNVILPAGGTRAYREFLLWVQDVVGAGKLIPLRAVTYRPLTCYSELVFIANRLRISYLAAGLRRRVQGLLFCSVEKRLSIDPGDVRDAAATLPQGHWLIRMMVNAIAVAESNGWLHTKFAASLQELYGVVPGLKASVEGRKAEVEQRVNAA